MVDTPPPPTMQHSPRHHGDWRHASGEDPMSRKSSKISNNTSKLEEIRSSVGLPSGGTNNNKDEEIASSASSDSHTDSGEFFSYSCVNVADVRCEFGIHQAYCLTQ